MVFLRSLSKICALNLVFHDHFARSLFRPLLRFLAFQRFLPTYNGNLKALLDHTTAAYNSSWDKNKNILKRRLRRLESALSTTVTVFGGKSALKKWNGTTYERRINRAVFDIMAHYFQSQEIADAAKLHDEEIVSAFRRICTRNSRFRASIEKTTKSVESVYTRLRIWGETLADILKMEISLPRMTDDNRISFKSS